MKALLKWLRRWPEEVRKPTRPKRITGGVIQCQDCGKLGHIAFVGGMDYQLSRGWTLAWDGLKPLYCCPDCGKKRRQFVLDLIANKSRD